MSNEILLLDPQQVPHHKIAAMHRDMSDSEFESIKLDIELNGQIVPVITYKGKLVDGRHRQRALIELGIYDMICTALPNNTSLEDVKSKVLGTEMRRTDNVAQKAIRALKYIDNTPGVSQQDAAVKFAVNRARISEAKKLLAMAGSDIMDKFYRNGYLILGNIRYTQLSQIIKYLSVDDEEQKDREPLSDNVKALIEQLHIMSKADDIAGIAQVEAYAKKLRMKD